MKRVLAVCLSTFAALAVWGQTDANKAQLYGTILDPQKAAVAGATVKIRNVNTGLERTLTTSGDGQYRAVQLDPGEYQVTAESSGFAPSVLKGIVLNVGSAVNADIQMQLQGVETTVDVVAMQSAVETAHQTLISATAIQDLPINGRRFQDFATLTPTVQVDPSRGQISFAGQRAINSNIMLDGADYSQPFFGGIRGGERSNYIPTVPQGAVQEFQAVTTGYAAEYGRSTGGILNVITKSGTNEWHGEGFYQNRDSSLSENGPIPVPDLANPGTLHQVQPAEGLQQWGGNVGGPIVKNKLFIFSAYEQQHAVQPRQVVFSALIGYTPTAANKPAYDFMKGLEQKFNKLDNAGAGLVKGDYIFNNGSRLTLRYNDSGSEEPNAVTVGGAIEAFTTNALSNEGIEKDRVHFGTAQYTTILSPTLINDLKFSGSYEERPRLSNSSLPSITVGNIGNYGARSFLPTTQWDRRYQITDSVSWTHGAHNLKLGTDIAVIDTAQTFGFNQFGSFNISSSNVGQILDILAGAGSVAHRFDSSTVSYNRQIGNLDANYGEKLAAFFVQDSWRVTSRLTLDLGFRWEGQYSPSVASNNTALADKVDAQNFIVGSQLNVKTIADQTSQFMPRFGFAWNPLNSNRLVVRGHTGIFYAATPLLLYSDPTANFRTPPNNVSLLLNNSAANGTVYTQLLNAGVNLDNSALGSLPVIPVSAVQAASAYALGGSARDPYIGASVTTFAPNYKNPRSTQAGFGADYQITSAWTTGVDFNYINTVNLERNRDYNQPFPTIRANDASQRPWFGTISGVARPISTLGSINVRESSARSMYRGMNLSARYHGKKLDFGLSYALAQSYSDDDNERDSGGAAAVNTYDYKPEYNYSNLDARHNIGIYGVYRLPWGFEVSALGHYTSGLPFTAVTGSDDNADGVRNDRPYQAPGVSFLRNSFRNRGVGSADMRVLKAFHFGERMRAELSAEMFNFMNIDNVVFGSNAMIYGAGLKADGTTAAIDPRFMRLKASDGRYDTQNRQIGFPFQAQFGARFFF